MTTIARRKAAEPEPEPDETAADEEIRDTAEEPEPDTDGPAEKPAAKDRKAAKEEDSAAPRPLSRDPLVRVALSVTVIAALVTAWFGWSYHSASNDESLAYARERDKVLSAAGQAIVNLNTLDYRHVDAGLKVWQDSSTAELYDEIVKGRSRLKSDIEKAETTSTAKVLESGLTELDTRAGKAAVIAAVRITITRADGKPVSNMRRLTGQLTRTSSGWKLSALGQAPTGTP